MPNSMLPDLPLGVPHLVADQGRGRPPRVVRAVSQEEKAALMTATEVVMSMTPERLIEPLRAASKAALREWVLALRPEDPYLPAVPEDLTSLEAALRSWLSHFRAYIDHTTGLLSRHFGGDVKAGFEQLRNASYDRNAAYLLAWGLRNYSQHRGEIVGRPRVPVTSPRHGPHGCRYPLGRSGASRRRVSTWSRPQLVDLRPAPSSG